MFAYLSSVKDEFYKITWTSREELRLYATIVVAATFVLGLGVYVVDLAIQGCLALLDLVIRTLFG